MNNRPLTITALALIILMTTQMSAISAQPDSPVSEVLGTTQFDQPFCMGGEVELLMDVYYPEVLDNPAPLVIYVHGGGWRGGDKGGVTRWPIVASLLERGYLFASVNYRLAPQFQFPAMIEDVKCAIRHFRAESESYNIDPDRIGVWGTSAGGHLVALLGTTDGSEGLEGTGGYAGVSSRVQAVVDMYGPIDLQSMFDENSTLMSGVFGVESADAEILRTASPNTWASPDDPPVLMIHGDRDVTVPLAQSEIFLDSLQSAGVQSQLIVVANSGHGFQPVDGTPSLTLDEISSAAVEFFESALGLEE